MISFDATSTTTRSLEVALGSAPAAQLAWVSCYGDLTNTDIDLLTQTGVTNSTTAVTVVDSPPADSNQYQLKSFYTKNQNAAQVTVIIQYNDNGTVREILRITLNQHDTLEYEDGIGWNVIDANGNIKETFGGLIVEESDLSPSYSAIRNLQFDNARFQVTSPAAGVAFISGSNLLTNFNISAGTTSNNLSNVVFSNLNGVTFGLNGSTITASAAGGGGGSVNFSAGTTSNNLATVVFSNSNNVSFGLNGSTITGSIATSLSNINISAGTTSNNLSAFVLSNSNGVSFGLNASTITGSHNGLTTQTNQQMTMFATSNTTQSSSGTTNASSLIFAGAGVASIGITNGSVVVSVPAGGGGLTNINVSAGTISQNLSNLVFSNSNGISFGLNGSTITAAEIVHSGYNPFIAEMLLASSVGQSTLHIQPMQVPYAFQFDRLGMRIFYSNATNSTGSATISFLAGIYTKNNSTLSLLISSSTSFAITFSGTVGNQSLQAGQRLITMGWTNTISESDYWIGILTATTTGGANATFSQFLASQLNSVYSGVLGLASNATNQRDLGFGFFSAATAAIPGSVAFSDIRGTGSNAHRPPVYLFLSGTA